MGRDRARAAEGVPVLRHGRLQPRLRPGRRDRRGAVGGARDRPGARLRRGDARRARRPDRPGRHERLRRPAAAAGDRPRPREAARRSTSSTTRSPRSTSPPTPGCGARCARSSPTPPCSSWPSGCPRSSRPTRSSCSRTATVVGRGTTTTLLETCATYQEIVALAADRRRRRRMSAHRAPVAATRRRAMKETERVVQGPGPGPGAVRRRHGRPEVACDFGPRPAAARAGCGPTAQGRSACVLLAVGQRGAVRRRARGSSARPPTWSSRAVGRQPAGRHHPGGGRRAAARRRRGPRSPTWSPRWTTSCPARASTSARWPRVLLLVRGRLPRLGARRLPPGLPAQRRRAGHRAADARRRRGQDQPAAAAATSTASRAASCSAGSPTTSTTSARRCSRR